MSTQQNKTDINFQYKIFFKWPQQTPFCTIPVVIYTYITLASQFCYYNLQPVACYQAVKIRVLIRDVSNGGIAPFFHNF